MNRLGLFFLVVIIIGLQSVLVISLFEDKEDDIRAVGIIGPMSGENSRKGLEMKRGAEMAIDEINESGMLGDIKLQLSIQDDQSAYNSRYFPLEAAKELVNDPQLLAVVGHFFSSATRAATAVYEKNRIPVISPTATYPLVTKESDWIFSMMAPDTLQSTFLANYVVHALEKENIAVLYTQRPYEEWQKDTFVRALKAQEKESIRLIPLGRDLNQSLLSRSIESLKDVDIIFLALRTKDVITASKYLKENGVNADLMGGGDIGTDHFIEDAVIYSEGIYAVNTFLIDLLGKKARDYERSYRDRYQDTPERTSVHTYETVHLIAQAIKKEGAEREGIRKFLQEMNTAQKGVEGLTGAIFFDKHGNYLRPFFVGQVNQGAFQPAEFQFVPVKHSETIEVDDKKSGVFFFNDRYMKRSTTVFTGISIRQVLEVDIVDSFFKVDFLIWFRWNGKGKESFDFTLVNSEIEEKEIVEQYFDEDTNESYVAYAIKAEIREEFPLHDYPFDTQTLRLTVKIDNASTEDIILVSDELDSLLLNKNLDLGTWINSGHVQYVDSENYIYTLKNPRYGEHTLILDRSLYNYDLKISRRINDYLIKLVPLLIIIIVNLFIFFVDVKEHFTPRLAASVTSLLSAVAFHMSQSVAHSVGYFVKSDWFFIIAYGLICLGILQTVFASYLVRRKNNFALAKRLDRLVVFLYSSIIILILYFIFYWGENI